MLFEICGASFLGIYIAAFKVTEAFNIIPLSIRDIILSSLSKFFYHSKESFRALYKLIFKYLAIIIVPIAVIITIFSEEIINFLYGAAFVKASSALSILIWSEIFIYLGILNRQILISSDNQIKDPIFTGIAAITNITLNVILIPKFNFVGAAISFLISSAMGSIMGYFISSTRDYSRSMFKALLKPFISVAVILLFINFLKPTKIIIFICFPFIYALILYLLKGIDASDLELVRVFSTPFLKKVK
jgi:O-antigen/teichoic acid export membrane protein